MTSVQVLADGTGVVSHAGAALLVELADRLGLSAGLSAAMAGTRERRSAHDPGRVVRDLAVMLADGGDCLSDLGALYATGTNSQGVFEGLPQEVRMISKRLETLPP